MHGKSIFGLSSLNSLYSLISKRCYIFDDPAKKNLLNISSWNDIFTAWMTYSMALASFWGQKYIDSWHLTSEAVLRSSEATFQSVLKWFRFHFHSVLMVKWQKKASMSWVQAWPQRLIWRLLRLASVNDWISRLMHKFYHYSFLSIS